MRRSNLVQIAPKVIQQSLRDAWAGQIMEWAAALSCYAVLSIFPLLLAGAMLASYVVDPSVVADQLSSLVEAALPPKSVDLDPVIAAAISDKGQVSIAAVILWLVSGRRILGALVTALDRVSDVDARHETVRRRAFVEFALLAGIGTLFLFALAVRPLLLRLSEHLWGLQDSWLAAWAVAGVQIVLLFVTFYALYTVVPRGDRSVPAAVIGAAVATGLVVVTRSVFLLVVDQLWASYQLIYGPVALAALLLTWGWLLGLIGLFGGSLASHVKVMVIEGKPAREAAERHVAQKRSG
jgi:membrane protein